MTAVALLIGFFYGSVSTKGQFCMNSGFSNVVRRKDTTKLKSYLTAILIQLIILPILFAGLFLCTPSSSLLSSLSLPPLFLVASAIGGFLFGIFMYFSGGCGAGIFYKIGEKNSGAIFATIGFVAGLYMTEKIGIINMARTTLQQTGQITQEPFWKGNSPLLVAMLVAITAAILLYLLFNKEDKTPKGAAWSWKKTGKAIGLIGAAGWIFALADHSPYGMSIIPGALDMVGFNYSWGLLFVLGIPLGSYWSNRKNHDKRFTLPKAGLAGKRLFGGLGLGMAGSIAAGCTVGHGLTFAPLLGLGSIVATFFIFLGSGLVGYLTR